jgi:tagaturonate epimerase
MMDILLQGHEKMDLAAPLSLAEGAQLTSEILNPMVRLNVYPRSIVVMKGSLLFLGSRDGKKFLGVISRDSNVLGRIVDIKQQFAVIDTDLNVVVAATTPRNAIVLGEVLPFLKPRTFGLAKSFGFGDRLGLATPGHIRAVRKTGIAPILAQQSVRENERTGRSPREVLSDAVWGAFQEGWRDGFGADADHLKTERDIEAFADAGYTFYTIDPGAYVDNEASRAPIDILRLKVDAVPWKELKTSRADLMSALAESPIDLTDFRVRFNHEEVLRAAAKYARVVLHTMKMYRHLVEVLNGRPFELEMSVDETETPTTLAEHVYLAHELKRLGVKWVSLAPRYVGAFEKGVDYIGSLDAFEQSFAEHMAVAKTFGPYKLSLHSGSDKLSIYPIVSRLAGDLFHVKTAGTSYLEALRTVARFDPRLFRKIAGFAAERYPSDRVTYHVSAELGMMPDIDALSGEAMQDLLDDFHARQVLHVTYGSVINRSELRPAFFAMLARHEEGYGQVIEAHFDRHLNALSRGQINP